MVDATYVTGTGVAVAGSPIEFEHTIQRDDAVVNLTGKTVTATIRRSWTSGVIDEDLEDIAVTLGATPASGEVDWTISGAVSELLAPYCPPDSVTPALFHLQYRVVEDDYYPQVFRFYVRSAAD
jgi:hypothetical protein